MLAYESKPGQQPEREMPECFSLLNPLELPLTNFRQSSFFHALAD